MTLRILLFSCTSLAGLAGPSLALTADEVWENQTGYLASFGIRAEAMPRRDGATLMMEDFRYVADLPLGLGEVRLTMPDVTYTENADGTVSIRYPSKFRATLGAEIAAEGAIGTVEAVFGLRLKDSQITARGTPLAVTYTSRTALMEVVLDNFAAEGFGDMPEDITNLDFALSVEDVLSETTITQTGNSRKVVILSTSGRTMSEVTTPDGPGAISTTVAESASTGGSVTLTLPLTPVDWLNLSPALRGGLALDVTAETAGSRQQTVSRRDDRIDSDLTQTLDRGTTSFTLSSAGMTIGGDAQDLAILLNPAEGLPLPVPVSIDVTDATFGLAFPVLADPEPQAASFDLALRGVGMPEAIWSMFDPGAILLRDPATLALAIDAQVINRVDLPDIMAWESVMDRIETGESPVDLVSFNVSGVEAAAIGTILTAEAAFTFDNGDRTTFPGFPRPEGMAAARMTGLYAALDRLAKTGLLSTEAAMGARAAIGMFAKATGEDELTSNLTLRPDGTLTVNGLPFPLP